MPKRRRHNAAQSSNRPRKLKFECPVCGHDLDCGYKPNALGRFEWFYNCPACYSRMTTAEFNDELRACGIAVWKLKAGRFDDLRPVGPAVTSGEEPAPLPGIGHIGGWASALHTDVGEQAMRYLTRRRGLLPETIRRYELGWDRDRNVITLPVYDAAGNIVNLRRRKLGPGEPFKGLRGRGSQLYPISALSRPRLVVVCEGEFDALVLNQLGFAAVTSTAGAGHWNPAWTPLLDGRRVVVVYDVDAEARACQRAAEFRAAGINATAVRLSKGGFGGKADVSDALVGARKSASWLRQLIRREQEAA